MLFNLLICCSHGLNLTLSTSTVSLTGTSSSLVIGWNPQTLSIFSLVFYGGGSDKKKFAGLAINGNTYFFIGGAGDDNLTQVKDSTAGGIQNAGQLQLRNLGEAFSSYPIIANEVYSLCLHAGALANSSASSSSQTSCGTYHTFTAQNTFTGNIDRNLGVYLGSKTLTRSSNDPARTANTYNVTLYASKSGSSVAGFVNAAIVIRSKDSATNFGFWAALSISTFSSSVSSMDFIGIIPSGASGDYFSKTGAITGSKPDNDSSLSCPNNVSPISFGSSTSAGNLYFYSHTARELVTGDISCDNTAVAGLTDICALYKQFATGSASVPFSVVQDDFFCGSFKWGQLLVVSFLAMMLL